MTGKPTTAAGYAPVYAEEAWRLCLYVATILGDLADEVVVVGGLVPYLLVDRAIPGREPHVGTRDLDLGLSLAVLDAQRYREIGQRLRDRGFEAGRNAAGNSVRQTWRLARSPITMDFLIPPAGDATRPGQLQSLERDFAAIVTPALPLAFRDAEWVRVEGRTPTGELAARAVRVCGAAAFVVLKAHALRLRGENKDAYDLVYLLANYGRGPVDVAARWPAIAHATEAQTALRWLAEDFASPEHLGPRRRTESITGREDSEKQVEAWAIVDDFLRVARM